MNNSYFVQIDSSAPAVTINSPANATSVNSSVVFNVTATDGVGMDSCSYSLDGAANVSMANVTDYYSATNASMVDGFHNVRFYCNDSGGNLNGSEVVWFTVDLAAPAVVIFQY